MHLPDLADWDRLTTSDQRRVVSTVTQSLPTGFIFEAFQEYELGQVGHRLAHFRFVDAEFVLIPGGVAALGFDPGHWKPTPEEARSWQETADELELDSDLETYLRAVTSLPRSTRIAACLVETTPREVGWRPLSGDHPSIREILDFHANPPEMIQKLLARRPPREGPVTLERHYANEVIRVIQQPDGSVQAIENVFRKHSDVVSHFKESGFRLPNSDEWEYFCSGGTSTLFRWGDHVPCDRYPTDINPEEANWRLNWVISGGELEAPEGGFQSDWDFHLRPNSFGLSIASPTPGKELLQEPGLLRGGDGGSAVCGGEGFFKGWLPLATSWCDERHCVRNPEEPISPAVPVARRVLRLD